LIIPWSHDSGRLRRRPLVTYAIILACIGVFLGTTGLGDPVREQARSELEAAYTYWEAHPYLEPPRRLVTFYGDPGADARAQVRAAMAAGKMEAIPQAVLAVQQRRLQLLVARADGTLHQHAWYRFGLVPADLHAAGFLGYMFLHSGWMHLIGNLLFLLLTGPFIEDRWGRGLFLLFYLCAGVVGAGLFVWHNPGSDGPLVGASGAIAGCMGAFLVRFGRAKIRFFYWLGFFFGSFKAPAWLMLPLWFANELASAATSAPGGVAYWAHVGGFGFGALCALIIQAGGVEARLSRSLGDLPEVAGGLPAEGSLLAEADSAVLHRETPGAELAAAIRSGPRARALAAWAVLADERDAAGIPAPQLLRLAGWLREAGSPGPAGAAVRTALAGADAAMAARIAKVARRFDPVAALRAALRARDLGGLDAEEQDALERALPRLREAAAATSVILVREDAPVERRRTPPGLSASEEAAAAFDAHAIELPEAERTLALLSDPGEEKERGGPPPRALRVRAGVPLALEEQHLRVELQGRGPARLPLARIDALAVAGVQGLGRGARAVLLIDLVLGWTDPGPLRVVRLRSDRFDPRQLVARAGGSPLQALRAFARELALRARAVPLPEGRRPSEPFRIFADLVSYEREVLGAERSA